MMVVGVRGSLFGILEEGSGVWFAGSHEKICICWQNTFLIGLILQNFSLRITILKAFFLFKIKSDLLYKIVMNYKNIV